MEGVEILNQFEVAVEYAFNSEVFGISLMIIAAIGVLVGIIVALCEDDWSFLVGSVVISVVCGVLMSTIIAGLESKPTKYETHYQVIITDKVKMNEFTEHYEILDQEGKIYTVRERNNE